MKASSPKRNGIAMSGRWRLAAVGAWVAAGLAMRWQPGAAGAGPAADGSRAIWPTAAKAASMGAMDRAAPILASASAPASLAHTHHLPLALRTASFALQPVVHFGGRVSGVAALSAT